jgi:hypothetical protein
MVNRCIFLIFLTQFILCVISTALFGAWSRNNEGSGMWYLQDVLLVCAVLHCSILPCFVLAALVTTPCCTSWWLTA